MSKPENRPWYAGEHQDALFYLLIAIFFVELIVGGVAFFYGIIHAAPETPGGPPMARFPWLAWAISAILAPVGLFLIVHLAGTWLSRAMTRDEGAARDKEAETEHLPEGMKRFYASVRHAPTLVVLLGILLLGAGVFFVEGAFGAIMDLGRTLVPYIPWIAVSLAALLAVCFLAHAIMVYRQRKLENEYAWRREVLEKTGLVLVDRTAVALPQDATQTALIAPPTLELGSADVMDITSTQALPENPGTTEAEKEDKGTGKDDEQ